MLLARPALARASSRLLVTLALACAGAPSAAAQAVTPLQVYLACRNPAVWTSSPTPEAARVRTFCTRPLPDPERWAEADSLAWSVAPPAATIASLAEATLRIEQQGVQRLADRLSTFRGEDLSGGLIAFRDTAGTAGTADPFALDPASLLAIGGITERLREAIRDRPSVRVIVRGYPDAPADTLQAVRRAQVVAAELINRDSTLAGRVFTEGAAPDDQAAARLPGQGGQATVHLELPLRVADALAALGEIRFPPGAATLDEDDRRVIARAAAGIDTVRVRAGIPVVVYGYADATGDRTANEALAGRRAEAIRTELLEVLDGAVPADRIVARGRVLEGAEFNSSASVRDQARSGAIVLGGAEGGTSFGAPTLAAAVETRALSAAPVLSATGVATAAAGALISRAERQVESLAFRTVATKACGAYSALLEHTCLLIHDDDVLGERYELSLANLQEAIRRDFITLPGTMLREALASRFRAELAALVDSAAALAHDTTTRLPPGQWTLAYVHAKADSLRAEPRLAPLLARLEAAGGWATVGAYGVEVLRRVSEGTSPFDAHLAFDGWLDQRVTAHPALHVVERSPAVVRLKTFSELLGVADSAVLGFRAAGRAGISSDTIQLYSLRAVLVSHDSIRSRLAGHVGSLVAAGRAFDRLLVAGDSLRKQLAALPPTTPDAVQARRGLVTGYLGEAAETVYLLLPDSRRLAVQRDTVTAIAHAARDVVQAVQSGSYRVAFTTSVSLISSLLSARPVVPTCFTVEMGGCGRLGLDAGMTRVAALVTDVGGAATGEEVRDAMTRFLDSGGGIASKRAGPPVLRVFVNGYVSGNLECGWSDCTELDLNPVLNVPIGVEGVFRGRRGESGPTASAFLRLVELSGFLPREGEDTDGRDTQAVISSIFRPGAFLVVSPWWGSWARSVPLAVGVGVSAYAVEENGAWDWRQQLSAFVGWDLPIFP